MSDNSDLSNAESIYSLVELQKMGVIDSAVASWIMEHPIPEDDPILVMSYYNLVPRAHEIADALVAQRAEKISATVFKFQTDTLLYAAQQSLKASHAFAFYCPLGSHIPGGHLLNQPLQQLVALPQARTIGTKLIKFYSESKFTLVENYEFFKW
uniref:Uncharacterized protein n=1 Tax=Panagrolaimus davidi TaxID=227884 RepID=A0A914QLV5_9BILA